MSLALSPRLAEARRPATAGTFGAWSPANVPEIAAGYFWLASSATGLGTAAFKVPEGNGNTSFDLVQATVASQPTQLTELGGVQFRMRRAGDANPSVSLATAGTVAAGWTGATYVAGWMRLPDASGDVTGAGTVIQHSLVTGNQRRMVVGVSAATPDQFFHNYSVDGIATGSVGWVNPFVGSAWVWVEMILDPALVLGGSGSASKWKLYVDFSLQSQLLAPTIDPTALFNGTARIFVGCRATGAANVDTTDWATVYYGNGIPSLSNREALYRHLAPR